MCRIWSEWDVGHENLVFSNTAAAHQWLELNPAVQECLDDEYPTVTDLLNAGLISFIPVEFVR